MPRPHGLYSSDNSVSTDGYFALAVAVIGLAINDVQHGTSEAAARARQDITDGGLDHWVDAVSIERGAHGRITEILRHVVEDGARSSA